MTRQHWFALLIFLSATLLFLASGCDEPNTPDIPLRPYSLISVYPTEGIALDVDAEGSYVAVAAGHQGALVLNVSNPAQPTLVARDTVSSFGLCTHVAIDAVHNLIFKGTDGTDPGDPFHIWDFVNQSWVIGIPMSGNTADFMMVPLQDSVYFYWLDYSPGDGFVANLMCRSDTTGWSYQCGFFWLQWPSATRLRGFDRRSDNIFAIAVDNGGVHFHDATTQQPISDVATGWSAFDCAWYGNYVMVADRYRLTVIDASDLFQPRVVSSLVISGADRLFQVAVDGNYAILLDELDGVYVVVISNPLAPMFVQQMSLSEATQLDAVNGKLYVTDALQGLVIYSR